MASPAKDMVIQRHERQFKLIDAYPDPKDSPTEAEQHKRRARDELLKELSKSKYEAEFIPYLQDTIEFLERSLNVKFDHDG